MTIQNPEILLVTAMVGLYLYDSALLLANNEALLSPGWKGKWLALFGADNFQIRGKEPFIPNPLLPHRPAYRFSWDTAGFVGPSQPWSPPGNVYRVLTPFIWCMAAALFVLIPLGLFSRFGDIAIATGVILFYANAVMALIVVWFKRDIFGVTGKQFSSLVFESLTCPPFAINVVRHLSLNVQPKEDFLSAANRLLDEDTRRATLKRASIRVQNEIDWEEIGTAHAQALNTHLKYLNKENIACQIPKS